MKATLTAILVAFALATLAAGCAPVRVWEREDLARMMRQTELNAPAAAYKAHFWMVREGSLGGAGQASGGCGCN